jgi:hypothetical protein
MRLLKNWTKFNEDNHGTANSSRYHFDENKQKIENVEFVLHKNGVYSLDLNFDLKQLGAEMVIPNIKSSSTHPYCLVSKDKTLLYKLEEYLKSLEFDDFNGVEWYDTRSINNAVCPFLEESEGVPYFGANDIKYTKPMMCEITKEDLFPRGWSKWVEPVNTTNNVIQNEELYKRCKENMGDLPEGKVFSYFTVFSHEGRKDGLFHIEVGIDVTEGLKKFLNL